LKRFSKRLQKNQLEGGSFDGSRLSITPVKAVISGEGEVLANQLDAMMPRIRITELLNEVAEQTGFLGAFTNLRTGGTCPNESALLAAILADATNLGLSRMANASQGVTRDQTPISARRLTARPSRSSSTPITPCRSHRPGETGRLKVRMASSFGVANASMPVAT